MTMISHTSIKRKS